MEATYKKKVTGSTLFAVIIGIVAFTGLGLAQAVNNKGNHSVNALGDAYGSTKVALCHNGHTITIAQPAVADHMSHGDTLGACQ